MTKRLGLDYPFLLNQPENVSGLGHNFTAVLEFMRQKRNGYTQIVMGYGFIFQIFIVFMYFYVLVGDQNRNNSPAPDEAGEPVSHDTRLSIFGVPLYYYCLEKSPQIEPR